MAFRYTKAQVLAEWRSWFANRKDDAEYKRKIYDVFEAFDLSLAEIEVAEEMLDDVMETSRRLVRYAQGQCPIAFLQPSWEQAQILNAWHPEFEPETAPGGFQSVAIFSANRIGKTCAVVINTLLWLLPNDPDWPIFQEFEDPPRFNEDGVPESGVARASRGRYRIHRRPDWAAWRRTGKLIMPGTGDSPMGPCEVWHGVENDTDYNQRIAGEFGGKDGYLAWMPRDALGTRPDGGPTIYKQERTIKTKYGQSIIGRTYNSDVMAWAGKAARIVNMDEGFEQAYLTEATTRVEGGGYFLWAYTPTEARNIGRRSKLAHDAYKGKLELVGKSKFFVNFAMEDAPAQVLDPQKKAADLSRFSKLGGEGRIRSKGGFFESSPVVFGNFERERNLLPIDGPEVLLAIRGVPVERWREEFGLMCAQSLESALYEANIVRGMDEGLANPTACAWEIILRTGEYLIFREFEASGLSVSDRAISIIDRSGNKRVLQNPGVAEDRQRWREQVPADGTGMKVRKTSADSKMFVRDELMPRDNWVENYTKAGLKLERAGNIGPAARCDYVNDMLRADPTRRHLLDANKNGARLYVTRDCVKVIERFENYLWQQIGSGQRAGEFTDKPEAKDDHIVDAVCYPAISKMRWRDPQEAVAETIRYDEYGAVIR